MTLIGGVDGMAASPLHTRARLHPHFVHVLLVDLVRKLVGGCGARTKKRCTTTVSFSSSITQCRSCTCSHKRRPTTTRLIGSCIFTFIQTLRRWRGTCW